MMPQVEPKPTAREREMDTAGVFSTLSDAMFSDISSLMQTLF